MLGQVYSRGIGTKWHRIMSFRFFAISPFASWFFCPLAYLIPVLG